MHRIKCSGSVLSLPSGGAEDFASSLSCGPNILPQTSILESRVAMTTAAAAAAVDVEVFVQSS